MKFLFSLLLLSFLGSCASGIRDKQTQVLNNFKEQKFSSALEILEQSEIKKNKKSKLIYLMEEGTINYYNHDYFKASRSFVQANELVDKLFTKSIRERLASSLVNESANTFYGSIFERSLLYYYQAMSFFKLSKESSYVDELGQEVNISRDDQRKYLNSARSSLLAWDSFFEDLKRSFKSKSILIEDMTSKLIAAKLHEQMGERTDLEISLQLYKDALRIFERFGPAYRVFNNDYKAYNKKLKKYLLRKSRKLKRVSPESLGHNFHATKKSIQRNLLKVARKIRPAEYKKLRKKFRIKSKKYKHQDVNIVVEVNHINRLKSKKFALNLNTALKNISDPTTRALVEGIGVPVLTYFALGSLGLGYYHHDSDLSIYSSHNIGTSLVKEIGIEFDLPTVAPPSEPRKYELYVLDEKKKQVAKKELTILNSLNDLAYINAEELRNHSFSARSLRIGIKYAVAIVAAYGTYKSLKKKNGDFLAKTAAFGQFLLSAKAIRLSEKADARHWSTLPGSILEANFDLPPGKYSLELRESSISGNTEEDYKSTVKSDLGEMVVNGAKSSLYSYRHF